MKTKITIFEQDPVNDYTELLDDKKRKHFLKMCNEMVKPIVENRMWKFKSWWNTDSPTEKKIKLKTGGFMNLIGRHLEPHIVNEFVDKYPYYLDEIRTEVPGYMVNEGIKMMDEWKCRESLKELINTSNEIEKLPFHDYYYNKFQGDWINLLSEVWRVRENWIDDGEW